VRILISAYACAPDVGSEPQVGFEIVRAAAREHEVWLVTRENNVAGVEGALTPEERERVHVIGHDLGEAVLRVKRALGRLGIILYYDLWQRSVSDLVAKLQNQVGFDVAHHATFATYWGRMGVAASGAPLVVGPVGGGPVTPAGMWPALGTAGIVGEIGRRILRPALYRISRARSAVRSASVVLAQNPETAGASAVPTRILPNGLLGAVESRPVESGASGPVVYAGRLVGWKGPLLAVAAWRNMGGSDPQLHVYGKGPDRRRLERAIARWGLQDRVILQGAVPREQVVAAIARAGAVVHPALHDDSPLSVAEALSLGVPLVCLDLAGPPVIASYWPDVQVRAVRATTPKATARRIAEAIGEVYGKRSTPDVSPRERFAESILTAYRDSVR
jgi:glycosyltransferase involved in cell wall biosynthesis